MFHRLLGLTGCIAWSAGMMVASTAFAQPAIPDHCFINGEIDCNRPGCKNICENPPTPGYESSPIVPPPSGLEKDVIEEGAMQITGRPRVFMPFHEEPMVLEPAKKKVVPEEDKLCDGIETDVVKDLKFKLGGSQHWIEITTKRIGNSFFNQYENFKLKQNNENLVNIFEVELAKQMCYKSGDRCILYGDQEMKKKLRELSYAATSLRMARDNYYDYIYSCTDAKLDCDDPVHSWKFDCQKIPRSCMSYRYDVERLQKAEEKKNQLLNEIKKMECTVEK